MRKLWVKFSDERNRKYSIKTIIWKNDNGKKVVTKENIYKEGIEHLKNIVRYNQILDKVFNESRMCPVEFKDGVLWFDFVEGESLESKYRKCVQEKDEQRFCELLRLHVSLICGNEENSCKFNLSDAFEEIFGEGEIFEGSEGLKISNFDAIASNIIFENVIPTFIDYEWVFLVELPRDLVIYHCIKDLYLHIHGLEAFFSMDRVVKYLKIQTPIEYLEQACKNFYHYVITDENGASFAGTKQVCLCEEMDVQHLVADLRHAHQEWEQCANYWKATVKAYDDLQKTCNEIESYWRQSSQANAQLNNKVLQLEKMLQEKTQESVIHQQEKQQWKSAYETVINSRTWRLARKLKKIVGRNS